MILEEPAKETDMDWPEGKKENQDSSVVVVAEGENTLKRRILPCRWGTW